MVRYSIYSIYLTGSRVGVPVGRSRWRAKREAEAREARAQRPEPRAQKPRPKRREQIPERPGIFQWGVFVSSVSNSKGARRSGGLRITMHVPTILEEKMYLRRCSTVFRVFQFFSSIIHSVAQLFLFRYVPNSGEFVAPLSRYTCEPVSDRKQELW
ncbi:hypothetical protein F4820DRAFT_227996 [Hypoxylon rubiginosum]|uniref:Uncharacterized protein n=1 Tax=Hypoxylon rubiginosum TaxID=110542 RepID=A0ACB9Z6D5_9PEZI|nr:hypothetical protein F4820DRAFT_227996 [Hypoxylon rubiginosum]